MSRDFLCQWREIPAIEAVHHCAGPAALAALIYPLTPVYSVVSRVEDSGGRHRVMQLEEVW